MDPQARMIALVKAGDIEGVRELLGREPALVNARSTGGSPAVVLATYYGHPEIAQLLIQRGAEMDIFVAAMTGHIERLAELLAEKPERANAVAADGFSPLGLASYFGHLPAVDLLLSHGAQADAPSQNEQRVTPLNSAAAGRHLEIAGRLLAIGADPNARQSGGFTPLHSAAQNGQLELVKLLVASGADPTARTDDGRTLLDFARESGNAEVIEYFEKKG